MKFALTNYVVQSNSNILKTNKNIEQFKLLQQLKALTISTNFAEIFKIIVLSNNYNNIIKNFEDIDSSYLL